MLADHEAASSGGPTKEPARENAAEKSRERVEADAQEQAAAAREEREARQAGEAPELKRTIRKGAGPARELGIDGGPSVLEVAENDAAKPAVNIEEN